FSASFASLKWQEEVKSFLHDYIDHLRTAGLYDRVIAYQIGCGTCSEWIKDWSSMEPRSGDFSEAMRMRFRTWLRQKYHDDLPAFQTAWADAGVTFETAEVPSGDQQTRTTHYLFRDPQKERAVLDFYECYAETAADALINI